MKRIGFNERYGLTTSVIVGTKTKTRRFEKCLDKLYTAEKELGEPLEINQQVITRDGILAVTNAGIIDLHTNYKIGEEVAVKASGLYIYHQLQKRYGETSDAAIGFKEMYEGMVFWTNKMFTPADLLPDHIIITGLRIERLQDISDEDCLKEGVYFDERYWVQGYKVENLWNKIDRQSYFRSAKAAFAALIERPGIGHKGDWSKNPWVLAYTFKLIK